LRRLLSAGKAPFTNKGSLGSRSLQASFHRNNTEKRRRRKRKRREREEREKRERERERERERREREKGEREKKDLEKIQLKNSASGWSRSRKMIYISA